MTGLATFTTAGSVVAKVLEYQLSGTGPHVVGAADLAQVAAELTAGGETLSAKKIRHQMTIPSAAAGVDTIPVFNLPCQVVIGAVSLIPAAAVVGDASAYNTYSLKYYSAAGAVGGTPATFSGTAGTMTAEVKQALTITGGTIPADNTVEFYRGTAGAGTLVPDMLLLIDFTL